MTTDHDQDAATVARAFARTIIHDARTITDPRELQALIDTLAWVLEGGAYDDTDPEADEG